MDKRVSLLCLCLTVAISVVEMRHVQRRQIDPSALLPEIAQMCAQHPTGNNSEAFIASHPIYCNAFVMCEAPTAHMYCYFCGEDSYFPQGVGQMCTPMYGANPLNLCQNRQFVPHNEIVNVLANGSCTALSGNPTNPNLFGIQFRNW